MTDLAMGTRVVRVDPHQGRHVKGHAEASLSMLEEVFEAAIGVGGRAKAGKLSHRPELASVHGGIDTASIGKFARCAEITLRQPIFKILTLVDARDVEPREGSEPGFAFLHRSVPPAKG